MAKNKSNAFKKIITNNSLRMQQLVLRFLDLALILSVIFLVFTDAKILSFHLTFIFLTFGAFYWSFRTFVWRTIFWVVITTIMIITFALMGNIPLEELGEIPMLTIILILVFSIAKQRKQAETQQEKLIVELREALTQVKTLKGLLPMCASCKKIRDDQGYWQQVEFYIEDHSEAIFSHGICPDCFKKLYPDYYKGD
ncbi:MAG: hypothetical protein FOGNACKC_05603 [Anaerolineae bacterium]|nr:hypothetical protein [Anaerolineae bacterium]